MNISIRLVLSFLGALSVEAFPATTTGDLGVGQGVEYVGLSDNGAITVLASSKVLSPTINMGKGAIVRPGNLRAGERVRTRPVVWSGAAGAILAYGVQSSTGTTLRYVKFDANLGTTEIDGPSLPSVSSMFVSGSFLVVVAGDGLHVFEQTGAGNVVQKALTGPSTDMASLRDGRSTGSVVELSTVGGRILRGSIGSNGSWTDLAADARWGSDLPSAGRMHLPAKGVLATCASANSGCTVGPVIAGMGRGDSLWIHRSGTWSLHRDARFVGASDLDVHDPASPKVRILVAGSRQVVVDLSSDAIETVGGISGDMYVRDANGVVAGDEDAQSGSGFGFWQGGLRRFLGMFHHRGELSIHDFRLARYLTSLNPSVLSGHFASSGSEGVTWTLHGTKRGTSTVVDLTLPKAVDYGSQDFDLDLTKLAEGVWDLDLEVAGGRSGSVHLYRTLVVDASAPGGSIAFRAKGANPVVSAQGVLRVGPASPLEVDFSAMSDLPWADSACFANVELIDATGSVAASWKMSRREFLADSKPFKLMLDGSDEGGIVLPDGVYKIKAWSVDSVGNASTEITAPTVEIGSSNSVISGLSFQTFHHQISGSVSPMLVTASTGYDATVSVTVDGTPGEMLDLAGSINGVPLASGKLPSSILLDGTGRWKWRGTLSLAPGRTGVVSGTNALLVTVSKGSESQSGEIPFSVDVMKTRITYPTEGAAVRGVVPVEGVATAPLGAASGGFDMYRAYYVEGNVNVPQGLTSLTALWKLASWKPMPVPFARQDRAKAATDRHSVYDGAYPTSNIGYEDRSGNGLLARFQPVDGKTGSYTLLVVSQQQVVAAGNAPMLSYDAKHIRWTASTKSAASLTIRDENVLSLGELPGVLDQTDSRTGNDKLPLSVVSLGGDWDLEWALVDGSIDAGGQPHLDGVQRLRGYGRAVPGQDASIVLDGNDYTGHLLETGEYVLVIEATDALRSGFQRLLYAVHAKLPVVGAGNSALVVAPNPVLVAADPLIARSVSFKVRLDRAVPWVLEVLKTETDGTKKLLREIGSGTSAERDLTWDFRAGDQDVLADLPDIATLHARLRPVTAGEWAPIMSDFVVKRVSKVVASSSQVIQTGTVPAGEDWMPDLSSGFKFRARAKGTLQYYPERRVDYAPEAQGTQVIRKFLNVPYVVDYLKYYNTLETITDSRFKIHGDAWEVWHRTVERGGTRNTFYSGPSSRSSLNVYQDQATYQAALQTNSDIWYGDRAHWNEPPLPAACNLYSTSIPYVNCARAISEGRVSELDLPAVQAYMAEYNKAYLENSHHCMQWQTLASNRGDVNTTCNVFALSGVAEIPDEYGDDTWDWVENGEVNSWFAKPGDPTSVGKGLHYMRLNRQDEWNNTVDRRYEGCLKEPCSPLLFTGNPMENAYWLNQADGYNRSHWSHEWSGNFENDAEHQAIFLGFPIFNWTHPYLQIKAQRTAELNQALLAKREHGYVDPVRWDGTSSLPTLSDADNAPKCDTVNKGTANEVRTCTAPGDELQLATGCSDLVVDDASASGGKRTVKLCYASHGGVKQGMRAYAYRPGMVRDASGTLSEVSVTSRYKDANGAAQIWRQSDYILNWFDRTDDRSGATPGNVYWETAQNDPSNTDDLVFWPRLDIGDRMFGTTWDTVWVPFPLGVIEQDQSMFWERDAQGRAVGLYPSEGMSYSTFRNDPAKYLKLVSSVYADEIESGTATSTTDYVASSTIDVETELPKLLAALDIRNPTSKYGVVREEGLSFQVPLRSWIVARDGSLQIEPNTNALKVVAEKRAGKWVADIRYLNTGYVSLGDWDMSQDPSFRSTGGWLYGAGELNADKYRPQDKALANGFLGFVNTLGLTLPAQTPQETAPFVVSTGDDGSQTIAFNRNISQSTLGWDVDVFYPDGSTTNLDLGVVNPALVKKNFELAVGRSGRSWVPFPGKVQNTLTDDDGRVWTFSSYRLSVRDLKTGIVQPVPVNRFFSTKDPLIGDVLPDASKDLWVRDASATPVLGWWDASHANGRFEISFAAQYVSDTDDGTTEEALLVQKNVFVVGTAVGSTTTPVNVVAPYHRAELTLDPKLVREGDVISVNAMSVKDLDLGDAMPAIQPVGPVLQVKTSSSTTQFPGDVKPHLVVRLSAREIYEDRGIDIATKSLADVYTDLGSWKSDYRIYMLSENGRLDAQPTLTVVQPPQASSGTGSGVRPEDVYIELSADVAHFSYALVLNATGHDGKLPKITSVTRNGANLHVRGRYEGGDVPVDQILFPDAVPTDLELVLADAPLTSTTYRSRTPEALVVDAMGWFEFDLPASDLFEGDNFVHVRYTGDRNAAVAHWFEEPSRLRVDRWTDAPDPVLPACTQAPHVTMFDANRSGIVVRTVIDGQGVIVDRASFPFVRGTNSIAWDACQGTVPLSSGLYHHRFHFESADVQDHLQGVSVGAAALGDEIESMVSDREFLVPSASDPEHSAQFTIAVRGDADGKIQLSISPAVGTGSYPLVLERVGTDPQGRELWGATWNGLDADGDPLPSGDYVASAVLDGSSASPKTVDIEIRTAVSDPQVQLAASPSASLVWPVRDASIKVSSTAPVSIQLWIEYTDGSLVNLAGSRSSAAWSRQSPGLHAFGFESTDPLAPLPVKAVLRWIDGQGLAGRTELALDVQVPAPSVVVTFPDGQSKIQPDLSRTARMFMGIGVPDRAVVEFRATESFQAIYEVRDASNKVVRTTSFTVPTGYSTMEWLAIDAAGSLVPAGNYRIEVRSKPRRTGELEHVVGGPFPVTVLRLPKAIVVLEDDAALSPHVADRKGFATLIKTELESHGVSPVEVVDAKTALGYMSSAPEGAVIFANEILPKEIYAGQPENSVLEYVRRGGRVAFFGNLPLLVSEDGGAHPEAFLPLVDGSNPYEDRAKLVRRAQSLLEQNSVNWIRPDEVSILTSLVGTDGRVLPGMNSWMVRKSTLEALGVPFSQMAGHAALDVGDEDWISHLYLQPAVWGASDESRGAWIAQPFAIANPTSTDLADAARDIGGAVFKYFFSINQYMGASHLALTVPKPLLRGKSFTASVGLGYVGDIVLPESKITLSDPSNTGASAQVTFANVKAGFHERRVLTLNVAADAAFGPHQLTAAVAPFSLQDVDGTTLEEANVVDNRVSVEYVVADDISPTLTVDGIANGRFTSPVSGFIDGPEFVVTGTAGTRHLVGKLKMSATWTRTDGSILYQATFDAPSAPGTWSVRMIRPSEIADGSNTTVKIQATDVFGNIASSSATVRIDTRIPTIGEWDIPSLTVVDDPDRAVPTYAPTSSAALAAHGIASDASGLARIEVLCLGGGDPTAVLKSTIDAADASSFDQYINLLPAKGYWILRAIDAAGNVAESKFYMDRDTEAPSFRLWKMTGATYMDRISTNPPVIEASRRAPDYVASHPLFPHKAPYQTQIEKIVPCEKADGCDGSPTETRTVTVWNTHDIEAGFESQVQEVDASSGVYVDENPSSPVRFVVEANDDAPVSFSATLDRVPVDLAQFNPWLEVGHQPTLGTPIQDAIRAHRAERYLEIPVTAPWHELVLTATDASGNATRLSIRLGRGGEDIQVVDPVDDNSAGGPDWGEVYMRQNTWVPPGKSQPEQWTYWLLHRRNPLSEAVIDQRPYRLYVDADDNRNTGDFQGDAAGADIALEFSSSGHSDDGKGISCQRYVWSGNHKEWVANGDPLTEGEHFQEGVSIDANQSDDPATESVGEGIQLLPSGSVAGVEEGVWEIGWKLSLPTPSNRVRWALLPLDGAGDKILDPKTDEMLSFQAKIEKPVYVDGFTPDWLDGNASAKTLEVRSLTNLVGTTLSARISLSNPGTTPVNGFVLRYFFTASTPPAVSLEGVPAGFTSKATVDPVVVRAKTLQGLSDLADDKWVATIRCTECIVSGGTTIAPFATLRLEGPSVTVLPDDWSNSSDETAVNARIPAYDAVSGLRFAGEEPHATTRLLPVAKITMTPNAWLKPGQSITLDASSSVDPEERPLAYEWHFAHSGAVVAGVHVTTQFQTAGGYRVDLKVYDPSMPERAGWATQQIVVVDDQGGTGEKPIREFESIVFDDAWQRDWNLEYSMSAGKTLVRDVDSVRLPDGVREQRVPSVGSALLSVPLDSLPYGLLHGYCDSNKVELRYWCTNDIDLTQYTNLEFWVSSDADVPEPIRIWIDKTDLGGNGNVDEEDYVYLDHYMADPQHPQNWQFVSIPLSELVTERNRTNVTFTSLKIMRDMGPNFTSVRARRLLLDDVKLVRYRKAPDQIVTTRRTSVIVTAKPDELWKWETTQNHIGMLVRLVNASHQSLQIDSLRMRMYYRSHQGETVGDIQFGTDVIEYDHNSTHPTDEAIDRSLLQGLNRRGSGNMVVPTENASRYAEYWWQSRGTAPEAGLAMPTSSSFSAWFQVGNYSTIKTFPNGSTIPNWPLSFVFHDGVNAAHYSWPRPVETWQVMPTIVVDHKRGDGTWGRIWGHAPDEDASAVQYWKRENLFDPSETGAMAPIARIAADLGVLQIGEIREFDGSQSVSRSGRALGYHWLATDGTILSEGPVWRRSFAQAGQFKVILRVYELEDPTNFGTAELLVPVADADGNVFPVEGASASIADDDRSAEWTEEWPWPTETTGRSRFVSEIAFDSTQLSCSPHLLPASGSSFLVLPFRSAPDLLGTQLVHFQASGDPKSLLDSYSNLEFWVASERAESRLPIRIWLTQQYGPDGAENHVDPGEEDFLYLQSYLPEGNLSRHWQRVSIPLREILQVSGSTNLAPNRLFLKIQVDNSAPGGAVDVDLRENVFLDGLRLVSYADALDRTVATRKVGLQIAIASKENLATSSTLDATLRIVNPSRHPLALDSLRIRIPYKSSGGVSAPAGTPGYLTTPDGRWPEDTYAFRQLQGNTGTDEGIPFAAWLPQIGISHTSDFTDAKGRMANHDVRLTWNAGDDVGIPAGRGFSAFFQAQLSYLEVPPMPLFANNSSLQAALPDWSVSYQMATGVYAEHLRRDGTWSRIWGLAPGESEADVGFWSHDDVVSPDLPAEPAGSYVAGTGTCTPPPPTGTDNTKVAAGDKAALPSTGRDAGVQTTPVVVGGAAGVEVAQTKQDWNIKHTFVFDQDWAARNTVLVDVYLDPAVITGSAWAGNLMVATFDGSFWLQFAANGSAALVPGEWVTLSFHYDPDKYTLGDPFDMYFLANGHFDQSNAFKYVIGSVRIDPPVDGGGATTDPPSTPVTPTPPTEIVLSGLDAVSDVVPMSGVTLDAISVDGRSALDLSTFGGGQAFKIPFTVDADFKAARTIKIDARMAPQFGQEGWEYLSMVAVNGASNTWNMDLEGIDGSIQQKFSADGSSSWTTFTFSIDPSQFVLGTTGELQIIVNANYKSASDHIYLDNLRVVP